MMHFKSHKKSGFSFIEIILAVAIIGIILTALLNLQSLLLRNAAREHWTISRIFNMQNLFFDQKANIELIKSKKLVKNIEDPQTKLTYEILKPKENSKLKRFENINILKATANWQGIFQKQEQTMINLFFNPQKPEKG